MLGGKRFNPLVELRLFAKALKGVKHNPLYIYSRVTDARRAGSKAVQLRRSSGEWLIILSLAVVVGVVFAYFSELGVDILRWLGIGQPAYPPYSGYYHQHISWQEKYAWLPMAAVLLVVLPIYLGWLATGLFRCTNIALGLLAQHTGSYPVLHLSEDLSATRLSGHEMLAAAMARTASPLIRRAVAGAIVLQLLILAGAVHACGLYGREIDMLSSIAIVLPLHALVSLSPALLSVVIVLLSCIVAGISIRHRSERTTLAILFALSPLVWGVFATCMLAAGFTDWAPVWQELPGMGSLVITCTFIMLALLYLSLLLMVSQPRRLLLFGFGLPMSSLVSAGVLLVLLFFGYEWVFVEIFGCELLWISGLQMIFNPLNSLVPVIGDYYHFSWYLEQVFVEPVPLHEFFRVPLLMLFQLSLIAILVRFARGLIIYKIQGRN